MPLCEVSVVCHFKLYNVKNVLLLAERIWCVQCTRLNGKQNIPGKTQVWDWRWKFAVLFVQLEVSWHGIRKGKGEKKWFWMLLGIMVHWSTLAKMGRSFKITFLVDHIYFRCVIEEQKTNDVKIYCHSWTKILYFSSFRLVLYYNEDTYVSRTLRSSFELIWSP